MNILIVDDHPTYAEGLAAVLPNYLLGFTFSVESNPKLALDKITSDPNLFDALFLDMNMPEINGLEFIERLRLEKVGIPVIVLSMIDDYLQVKQLLEIGISGFIPKYFSVNNLVAAIKQCIEGFVYIPPEINHRLKRHEENLLARQVAIQHAKISRRELEVLVLMEKGMSNKNIAGQLSRSVATVKTHINHLFSKLSSGSNTIETRLSCLSEAQRRGIFLSEQ